MTLSARLWAVTPVAAAPPTAIAAVPTAADTTGCFSRSTSEPITAW